MKITGIRFGMLRVPLKTPFKTALRRVEKVRDIIVTHGGRTLAAKAPSATGARVLIALAVLCVGTRGIAADQAWSDARQLVLVTTSDWSANQGTLRTFRMTDQGWRAAAPAVPVTIGRKGAGWGVGLHATQPGPAKREGDGRSPAGVFRIGGAFGYAEMAATALPYTAMSESDYCIDVSTSPLYNRIVDAKVVGKGAIAGSTEPMRRDLHVDGDQGYKVGFIIEHNSAGGAALGSCIFAHVWKAPGVATSGCTAMAESAMRSLLAWLQPQNKPIFVLLPQQEYARYRTQWHLPRIDTSID